MQTAALALVAAGTAVVALAALAAVAARDRYQRLHSATLVTSLGGPLVGLGCCLLHPLGLTTAAILFPIGLLFLVNPAMSAAVGRMLAQNEGRVDEEQPE